VGLIEDKILTRASEAGYDSLLDYYYYLRYDPGSGPEFDGLVDSLVVNETYFFREASALNVVVDDVLLPRIAAGSSVRAWSAACSTGEEPYTLAMLLAERGQLAKVELIATDISEKALALARSGTFRARSVRSAQLPSAAREHLTLQADRPVLARRILDAVDFRRLNLMDAERVRQLGRFDLILCRNVLIYFSDETVQRVVTLLTEVLRPGGVLLVGTCESLLRHATSLSCEEHRGVFFYRKPLDA
jgi:chemotaxis protein methyltransferase CheR